MRESVAWLVGMLALLEAVKRYYCSPNFCLRLFSVEEEEVGGLDVWLVGLLVRAT